MRSLYAEHGPKIKIRTYYFYLNLYGCQQQKPVLLVAKHKLDAQTNHHLPKIKQSSAVTTTIPTKTSYFYRTNEQLLDQLNWLRTLVRAGEYEKLLELVRQAKIWWIDNESCS